MEKNVQQTKGNKEIIERFITNVFNKHDFSMLNDIMREDYIQHNPDVPTGRAAFKRFFEQTFKAMPDFHYTIHQIVAEGDRVIAYCSSAGTHTGGEWLGQPATGNTLDFHAVDIFRLQDGKIAEHWDVADTFKLFAQLGIIERLLADKKNWQV
jgi:steroid delta-isomerase-like uncharacterized protein